MKVKYAKRRSMVVNYGSDRYINHHDKSVEETTKAYKEILELEDKYMMNRNKSAQISVRNIIRFVNEISDEGVFWECLIKDVASENEDYKIVDKEVHIFTEYDKKYEFVVCRKKERKFDYK